MCIAPASAPGLDAPSGSRFGARAVWALVGAIAIIGAGYVVWSALNLSAARAAASPGNDAADARQQDILREDIDKAGSPELASLYQKINAAHFGGALPAMPILWEPRLAEVGALAARPFTLEGIFGHVGRRTAILLNSDLRSDTPALKRALCHEMVHAYLFSTGDTTTNHGPAFQAVLLRLSTEGAFEGVLATEPQRQQLRAWLDAESARLDAERAELERLGAEIAHEHADVERDVTDLQRVMVSDSRRGLSTGKTADEVNRRREAYNARAEDANGRVERQKADVEAFNRQVARYNLMLVYPDGLDEDSMVKPKGAPVRGS